MALGFNNKTIDNINTFVFNNVAFSNNDKASTLTRILKGNRYSVLFEGRLYNGELIKEELLELGYIFLANTDTEIVLFSYLEYGNNFITKLDGIFSLAIYDFNHESLFVARDKLGIKPLYYAEGDDYMIIDIPVAFATDKLTKKDVEVVYTVTGPNGSKPTVTDYEDETKDYIKSFKATAEGTYTIKYSATDDAGNESTHTITIEVGDCQKPTLSWVDKSKDAPTEIELNKTYALDLNTMLKMSDNETANADLLENITVQMTGPDGSTVDTIVADGEEYQWKFTKSGNYNLRITVKDKVGNVSDALTHTINVPAEETDENKVSPVLGTVLVVLSVVVLAGVVVYFVATSKKKSTKNTSKKTK